MTRDEAINTLANFKVYISGGGVTDKKANEALDLAIATLVNLPSADRPTGEWINGRCDQCGGHAPFWPMASTYHKSKFCPDCGARMLKGEDNENDRC